MPARSALLDGGAVQTVHDDLEHRVHARRAARSSTPVPSAQRRTVRIVGGRDHLLVALRADLAAGAHHAAGKGQHDTADLAHRLDRRFRRRERGVLAGSQNQEVAAADRPLNAERLFAPGTRLPSRESASSGGRRGACSTGTGRRNDEAVRRRRLALPLRADRRSTPSSDT